MVKSLPIIELPSPVPSERRENLGFWDRLLLTYIPGIKDAWAAQPEMPAEKILIDRVAALSAKRDIPPPKLLLFSAKLPNAFSIAPSGSIALSADLPNIMTPEQVDAVIAHELSHHRHRLRDAVVVMSGIVTATGIYVGLLAKRVNKLAPVAGIKRLAFKLGEGIAIIGAAAAGGASYRRACELEADREAAQLVSPQAKIGALEALQGKFEEVQQQEALGRQKRVHCNPDAPGWQQLLSDTARELEPQWFRHLRRNPMSIARSHPSTYVRLARLECIQADREKKSASPHTIV